MTDLLRFFILQLLESKVSDHDHHRPEKADLHAGRMSRISNRGSDRVLHIGLAVDLARSGSCRSSSLRGTTVGTGRLRGSFVSASSRTAAGTASGDLSGFGRRGACFTGTDDRAGLLAFSRNPSRLCNGASRRRDTDGPISRGSLILSNVVGR
jgi:hypothetical protein